MPLLPEHLEKTVSFFTSSAWANLRAAVEEQKPEWPTIQADALMTAAASRRREGYELCLTNLMREAGVIAPLAAPVQDNNQPQAVIDPQKKAMDDLLNAGEYVDTHTD